jgi:hypothetical protein
LQRQRVPILGGRIVQRIGNQPSLSILGVHRAHMTSVQDDFSAALGGKVEIAVAPPPWRSYTFHCNDPSNLPRFARGIFCV